MINSRTAGTFEIDDVQAAVGEILQQLDLDANPIQKYSVGIISCYAEYLDSGVVKALSEALPFELIGTTSIACGGSRGEGETMLALLVLTSDDVEFATTLSAPLKEEDEAPLEEMYKAATAKLTKKPALMLSYAPLLTNVGGDFYVESLSKISGGLPNFGTLVVDHNSDYHQSQTILNGDSWTDRSVILLLAGAVEPTFTIGTISDAKVFPERATITAAKGNQIQTIDGMLAVDYLQTIGLEKNEDGSITGINTFPIVVDFNDGTMPAVRAMFSATPEGYVVCGANTPAGATFSIGSFDPDEIQNTTTKTLEQAIAKSPNATFLTFSCIGRFFALGYNGQAEMKAGGELLRTAKRPFIGAYSGGEICPVFTTGGTLVNRFHGNTFIICAI